MPRTGSAAGPPPDLESEDVSRAATSVVISRADVMALLVTRAEEQGVVGLSDASALGIDILLNSIEFMELQVAIEEELDVELDPLTIIELGTVGRIVDYIYGMVVRACPAKASE